MSIQIVNRWTGAVFTEQFKETLCVTLMSLLIGVLAYTIFSSGYWK